MRNHFPGVCYRCGKPVAAGDGHFELRRVKPTILNGWRRKIWATQHASCAIEARGHKYGYG